MVVDYYFREGFAAKHKINFLTITFKVLCQMLNFYLTKNHEFKAAFKQDQKTESLRTNIRDGFWGETPANYFPSCLI